MAERKSLGSKPVPLTIATTDTKTGTSAVTHNLTSVTAGALLVVTTGNQNSSTNCTVSSSPTLTWTKQVDNATPNAEIWTAVYTAGGNINVTANWGSNRQSSVCYVVTGQYSPPGGNTNTASSQNAPNLSVTSSRINSLIFCITTNWNAITGTRTYRGAPTESYYNPQTESTFFHYYYTCSTVTSYTLGFTAPSDIDNGSGTAALEIKNE